MRINHRIAINGDRAEVFFKGYALDILERGTGSHLWEDWGDYVYTLERTTEGWKCSDMTFVVTHARGNDKVRAVGPHR